jgi:hypothetical protein
MENLKFYIDYGNGFTQVDPPRNWQAFEIGALWTDGHPSASIETTDFEWTGVNATRIRLYRDQGMTGVGPGIFEGLPMQITACQNNSIITFNGVLDLSNAKTRWECDKIVAPFVQAGIDLLHTRAQGFGFDYLASLAPSTPGRIVPGTDYKRTPYAITEIPDYTQAMLLSVSSFVLIKELLETTTKLSQLITQLTGDAATAVATLGTAAPTLVARIAMIALQVTYLFLIIVALVNLVQDLISNIIQTKKYKLCMLQRTLWTRACQYMGYTFSSTIYAPNSQYYNATWMPRKTVIPNPGNPLNVFDRPADEGQGFPNNPNVHGYFEGTFADFIQAMCTLYNGEVKLFNNVLYFEERHAYVNTNQGWQIPNTMPAPDYSLNLPDPHTTNAAELPCSMRVHYQLDQSELNTLARYRGTSVTCTIEPLIVRNKKNVQLGAGRDILMPCALGKRKEYLTRIETLLNGIINALFGVANAVLNAANVLISGVNAVLSLFGGNAPQLGTIPLLPTNIINNRIGWLVLSNDSFAVPKVFIGMQVGQDWELSPQTEIITAANTMANAFHFKELPTRGNQAWVYRNHVIKFCCEDWNTIVFSNYVRDPTGFYSAELLDIKWNPWIDQARVDFQVYRNFTNNLTEKIVIDGN